MHSTGAQLRATAESLCLAFAGKADQDTLLSHFSDTHAISAFEHGLPHLAPFLGRLFTGRRGPDSVPAYFALLSQYLTYEDMTFGPWVVDADSHKVCVKGRAKFTWSEGEGKGQSWHEQFVYMFDFDQDGKITDYQVWADSGAAYLAKRGELEDVSMVRSGSYRNSAASSCFCRQKAFKTELCRTAVLLRMTTRRQL